MSECEKIYPEQTARLERAHHRGLLMAGGYGDDIECAARSEHAAQGDSREYTIRVADAIF